MPHGSYASVVVPLDGSPRAERALPVARSVAAAGGASLVLVTVVEAGADAAARRLALEQRAAELQRHGPTVLTVEVEVRTGPTLDELVDVVASLPDPLVCMSTRGRGTIARTLLGSVADGIVRSGAAPVLLTGPALRDGWDAGGRARVLVGVDGSSAAATAISAGGRLARVLGGDVVVVEVLEPMIPLAPGARVVEGTPAVADGVAALRGAGLEATGVVVEDADVAGALLRTAEAHGASVVCVATHGRGGLARIALGSVADRMVRDATVPVLVARPTFGAPR
jgi:nucleotide-binding universal stress UspA family protein